MERARESAPLEDRAVFAPSALTGLFARSLWARRSFLLNREARPTRLDMTKVLPFIFSAAL
jgi:hypothetical protein